MELEILEKIGLTKSEAEVYLALLELGSSATGKIVDKSKASSSKIYEILDRLMQKGLASFIIKNGIKHYEAAAPDRIIDYLKEQEQEIKKREAEIKDILPQLKLKQQFSKLKSEATIYKGWKGIETSFKSALASLGSEEEWLVMGVPKRSTIIDNFFQKFRTERASKSIKTRMIVSYSVGKSRQIYEDKMPKVQIKYLPQTSPAAIHIINDHVMIFPSETDEDLILFDINNKQVAESFRVYFETLWNEKARTYQGVEAIRNLIRDSIKFGDYDVFAEGMKIVDTLGLDFFKWWQIEKKRQGIKSRGIMGERYRNEPTSTLSTPDWKFIAGYEAPGVTLIFKDKVINLMLEGEPIAILIENKDVADANRIYFDMLWNQDVSVSKGLEAVKLALYSMLDELSPKDEYLSLGATFGKKDVHKEYTKIFHEFHKERSKRGVAGRVLFQRGHDKLRDKYMPDYFDHNVKAKTMPYESDSPVAVYPYHDKTVMIIEEKDPIVIKIDNSAVSQMFKRNFDTLWNQDVEVVEGLDKVTSFFNQILTELKKGEEYFVINANYGETDSQEFFIKYHQERQKVGIKANLLFNSNMKNVYKDIAIPPIEYKFLQNDFKSPLQSVFYKDRLMLALWIKNPIGIIIKRREIVDAFRSYFDVLWNQDTTVVKGMDNLIENMKSFLDSIDKSDTFDAFGTGFGSSGMEEEYAKTWKLFHDYRKSKGIKARWLFQQGNQELVAKNKFNYENGEVKFLPYKTDSPVAMYSYKDKALIMVQGREPSLITINNKEIADAFHNQFETVWNQDVTVIKGWKVVFSQMKLFMEELKEASESYSVIGAGFGSKALMEKYVSEFVEMHKHRIKLGVRTRMLFRHDASQYLSKYGDMYTTLSEYRYVQSIESVPAPIFCSKNKIMLMIQDQEPTLVIITNQHIAKMFNNHFESLWNQEVTVMKGLDAIELAFEEMLKAGSGDFIGARGYFFDKRPDYIKGWISRAKSSGFELRNIVDPDVRGHWITTLPFAKTHYTLRREFSNMSVFWIYGEKVAISNWAEGEPIVIFINNKKIHDMYKQQFEMLWAEKVSHQHSEKSVQQIYDDLIEHATKKDDIIVFAAKPISNNMSDFNLEWNKRMNSKARSVRLLYYGLTAENIARAKAISKFGPKARIIETEETLPISTVVVNDTIVNTVWDKEPTAFRIQNISVAESLRSNFDLLWEKAKKDF